MAEHDSKHTDSTNGTSSTGETGSQKEAPPPTEVKGVPMPIWCHVVEEMLNGPFQPGEVVSHEWLASRLHHRKAPDGSWPDEYYSDTQNIVDAMIETHGRLFISAKGIGYLWVPEEKVPRVIELRQRRSIRYRVRKDMRALHGFTQHCEDQKTIQSATEQIRRTGDIAIMLEAQRKRREFSEYYRMKLEGKASNDPEEEPEEECEVEEAMK